MAKTLSEVISKVQAVTQHYNPSLEASLKLPTIKENIPMGEILDDTAAKALKGAIGGDGSIVDITRVANIEPRVLIEESLISLPGMDKFLLTLTNFYSAHYLQAVALTNTIGRVSVLSRLDALATDRNLKAAVHQKMGDIGQKAFESLLDYGYVLPKFSSEIKNKEHYNLPVKISEEAASNQGGNRQPQARQPLDPVTVRKVKTVISQLDDRKIDSELKRLSNLPKDRLSDVDIIRLSELAAEKERRDAIKQDKLDKERKDRLKKDDDRYDDDKKYKREQIFAEANSKAIGNSLKRINDVDNIAVGRMLEVVVRDGVNAATIPVAVRMRPMMVPQLIMRELVSFGDIRESWTERWHRWKAGELNLISDIIFQSDRINKKRKLIALDKKGIYRDMIERRNRNLKAAMVSGNPSLGSASSFIIVSKETAREVEYRTGSPLDNVETRNLLFSANSAMMLIIIDREWERIQCYTRGISSVADYSFKQFEGMSKGNGPDISEIMKAYTLGNNPRF